MNSWPAYKNGDTYAEDNNIEEDITTIEAQDGVLDSFVEDDEPLDASPLSPLVQRQTSIRSSTSMAQCPLHLHHHQVSKSLQSIKCESVFRKSEAIDNGNEFGSILFCVCQDLYFHMFRTMKFLYSRNVMLEVDLMKFAIPKPLVMIYSFILYY